VGSRKRPARDSAPPQGGAFPTTSQALESSAHVILVLDLVLFFAYLVMASIDLVKAMVQK
jgi:hypothetical protein